MESPGETVLVKERIKRKIIRNQEVLALVKAKNKTEVIKREKQIVGINKRLRNVCFSG